MTQEVAVRTMKGRMTCWFVDEVTQDIVSHTKPIRWSGETVEECRQQQLLFLEKIKGLVQSSLFGWDYNPGAERDKDFELHLNTEICDEQTGKVLFQNQMMLAEVDTVEKKAVEDLIAEIRQAQKKAA